MKFLLVFTIYFYSVALAGDFAGWFESLVSGVDCAKLSERDFTQLTRDCVVCAHGKMSILDSHSTKNYSDILEQMYFDREAQRHVANLSCQINQSKGISGKSEELKMVAKDIVLKIPVLKELLVGLKNARIQLNQQGIKLREVGVVCNITRGEERKSCLIKYNSELQKQDEDKKMVDRYSSLIAMTMASVWNGPTQAMQDFLKGLMERPNIPTVSTLMSILPKVSSEIINELNEQKGNIENRCTVKLEGKCTSFSLSEDLKRDVVLRSIDSGPLKEALDKKDESAQKLFCQVNNKYVQGVDRIENTMLIGGLAFGGLGGLLPRIGLMMRGEKLLSLRQKTIQAGKASSVVGLGSSIAFDVNLIQKQCFNNSYLSLSQESCLLEEKKISENEKLLRESRNCFLAAALGIAPPALLVANPALKVFAEQAKSYLSVAKEVGSLNPKIVLPVELQKEAGRMKGLFEREQIVASSLEAKTFIQQNHIDAVPVSRRIVPVNPEREKRCLERIEKLKTIIKLKMDKIKKEYDQGLIKSDKQLEEVKNRELSRNLSDLYLEYEKLEKARNGYSIRVDSQLANKIRTKDDLKVFVEEKGRGNIDVYLLKSAPMATKNPSLSTPFLFHPLFVDRFEKLKKMGVEIVLDSQLARAANYNPKSKTITINPSAGFDYLEHEYTHALFEHYVRPRILTTSGVFIKEEIRTGVNLKEVLTPEGMKALGDKKVAYFEGLMKKYHHALTLDESLATYAQLQKIGLRPVSSEFYLPKWYGANYRVAELREKMKHGPLTAENHRELSSQLMELSLNYKMYSSVSKGKEHWNKNLEEISLAFKNGNAALALTLANGFIEKMALPEKTEANLFINESGEIIKISRDPKNENERFDYFPKKGDGP